jgi:RND family efflux transporter MFP subunit
MNTERRPARSATLVLLLMLAAGLLWACGGDPREPAVWHCPMHPTYVADGPGDCPICNMKLVPVEGAAGAGRVEAGGAAARTAAGYRCPTHPAYASDRPGRCPVCGMDLEPVEEPRRDPGRPAEPPAGYSVVRASGDAVRLAGVRTAAAVRDTVVRTVRAVGIVRPDETRVRQVNTRISGWVEKLSVDFTGQFVRAGDPLLTVYSPELAASQEEYLRALEAVRRFETSSLPEVRRGAQDLLQTARTRLLLFDVPESLLAALERTGAPQHGVTLEAPSTGFVTGKEILAGARVDPGMSLFTIADLSRVWVEADVYEYEASLIERGSEAVVTLPYDPAFRREVPVAYVYPTLDPATRTLRVRVELPNPGLRLRPDMFADVEIRVERGGGTVIPDDAILDSGARRIVFVETEPGTFEPREVAVGVRSGGRAQILSGVEVGERVVVRANFLLDSESRLRAAIAGFTGARGDAP